MIFHRNMGSRAPEQPFSAFVRRPIDRQRSFLDPHGIPHDRHIIPRLCQTSDLLCQMGAVVSGTSPRLCQSSEILWKTRAIMSDVIAVVWQSNGALSHVIGVLWGSKNIL